MTLRRFIAFAAICGLPAAACGTRATEQSAVRRGDEAFALGGQTSAESYLVFEKLLDAATFQAENAATKSDGSSSRCARKRIDRRLV